MTYVAVALVVLIVVLEVIFPGYFLLTLGGITLVMTAVVFATGEVGIAAVFLGFTILCFAGWYIPRRLFAKKKK